MNALKNSSSPYLRQHATNPVDWLPWSEEAITRARNEQKPILLSVGYSTCYWCHVMEREVFENPSIATVMNRDFINIKVDREEHPDIDAIYMVARQLMKQEGGWPNNVFLTPELKPFFGGGTFGPEDAYGRPGFPRLLESLHKAWTERRDECEAYAQQVAEATDQLLSHPGKPEDAPPPAELPTALFQHLSDVFDGRAGGFYQSPKFPHETYLMFLQAYYRATGNMEALNMVSHTLARMAAGGLYDHVGAGFHRYAVDKDWMVPHFEKMLYNQALLALTYTEQFAFTNDPYLSDIARSILDVTCGPFSSPDGGFYSAIDAETDGVEGAYYAFTADEIEGALNEGELGFFTEFYTLAEIPAFPGHKHPQGQVIHARKPLMYAAAERGIPYTELAALSGVVFNKLLELRNARKAPRLDDKIIVSWNGLMIHAYARGADMFQREDYADRAEQAARFLLKQCRFEDGTLTHIHAGGKAHLPAMLEDYAYLIAGLLALARASNKKEWLTAALALEEEATRLLYDEARGCFYSSREGAITPVRIQSGDDNALPSPNAVMLQNFLSFHALTKNETYKARAQQLFDAFRGRMTDVRQLPEYATLLAGGLKLFATAEVVNMVEEKGPDVVFCNAELQPADPVPGSECTVLVTLTIQEGWEIGAHIRQIEHWLPLQVDVRGVGVESILSAEFSQPVVSRENRPVYRGSMTIKLRLRLKDQPRGPLSVHISFQPCREGLCALPVYRTLTL